MYSFLRFFNATLHIIICPFELAAGELGCGLPGALPGGEQGGEPGGLKVPDGTLHALPVGEGGVELPALGLTSGAADGVAGGIK